MLDRFFGRIAAIVARAHGTLDKFIGDGLLAVFGVPEGAGDHGARAVDCALAMQREFRVEPCGLGVGVATGEVLYGPFGSGRRADFTSVGPAVNLAARLAKLARPGEVLVDDATRTDAAAVAYEPWDGTLPGWGSPPPIWRAVAPSDDLR